MVAWQSSGEVLRWWRTDVRGLTQQQAADRLCVQSSSLSNWERGTRAISLGLDAVDQSLEGGRTLAGLLWAFGTPTGLEPGCQWTKVFPGPSRPVWLWLRGETDSVTIEAEWGVARLEATLDLGPNGTFITVGASVPDSPVVVNLAEPGWADFGYGDIPTDVPEADVVPAITMIRPSSAEGAVVDLFRGNMAAKIVPESGSTLANLTQKAPTSVIDFLAGSQRSSAAPLKQWPTIVEGSNAVERRRFALLREARGMSLSDTATRLTSETGIGVGRDTLRRFETGVGQPHDRMLPVALDHVLGADGRLAVLDVRSHQGSGATMLPPFWRGPIWLEIDAPPGDQTIVLQRGRWQRDYRVDGPSLISTHWFDPSVPLQVRADPSIGWTAGVGRRGGATPIDQEWIPITIDVAQRAVSDIEHAFLTALERHTVDPT